VTDTSTADPAAPLAGPKPRRAFIFMGVLAAAVLGVGLFTSIGTKKGNSSPPHAGGSVPTFTAERVNGGGSVDVPADGGSGGKPAVLMFFGNWCTICHTELPPIAAAVKQQDASGGSLSKVRVIGIDSEDTLTTAKSFIHRSGVSFPVAYDQNLDITNGDFYFTGDPYAVFVNGNGTIKKIVGGPISVSTFTADEQQLIPSGS
jgi:thiol-disulfide isomerase/thioredoxin